MEITHSRNFSNIGAAKEDAPFTISSRLAPSRMGRARQHGKSSKNDLEFPPASSTITPPLTPPCSHLEIHSGPAVPRTLGKELVFRHKWKTALTLLCLVFPVPFSLVAALFLHDGLEVGPRHILRSAWSCSGVCRHTMFMSMLSLVQLLLRRGYSGGLPQITQLLLEFIESSVLQPGEWLGHLL